MLNQSQITQPTGTQSPASVGVDTATWLSELKAEGWSDFKISFYTGLPLSEIRMAGRPLSEAQAEISR